MKWGIGIGIFFSAQASGAAPVLAWYPNADTGNPAVRHVDVAFLDPGAT